MDSTERKLESRDIFIEQNDSIKTNISTKTIHRNFLFSLISKNVTIQK